MRCSLHESFKCELCIVHTIQHAITVYAAIFVCKSSTADHLTYQNCFCTIIGYDVLGHLICVRLFYFDIAFSLDFSVCFCSFTILYDLKNYTYNITKCVRPTHTSIPSLSTHWLKCEKSQSWSLICMYINVHAKNRSVGYAEFNAAEIEWRLATGVIK